MGVLGQASIGVVDADDDQRLDLAGADGLVGVLANLPGAAGDEGGAGIEEVLAVLEVEDGVSARWMAMVAGRDVDDKVAFVGQVMAGEGAMEAETGMRRGGRLGFRGGEQTLGGRRPGGVVREMLV